MALFRGIQEYIALDANNITLVSDSGNIVNISGNIFLYPPQGHPILYNCLTIHGATKDHTLSCSMDLTTFQFCPSIALATLTMMLRISQQNVRITGPFHWRMAQ